MEQPFRDPFACLYEDREPLFEGYAPEQAFGHGKRVVIARYAAANARTCSAVLHECRLPAQFFIAHVTLPETAAVRELRTGSGANMGVLLHRLCAGLASGKFKQADAQDLSWVPAHRAKASNEDGCNAQMYAAGRGRYRVHIEGKAADRSLELDLDLADDRELALALTGCAAEGMLGTYALQAETA